MRNNKGNYTGGIIMITLGVIFLCNTVFNINLFSQLGKFWPLILVALGVSILLKERNKESASNNYWVNSNETTDTKTQDTTNEKF